MDIGKLNAMLTATAGPFVAGFKQAGQATDGFSSSYARAAATVGRGGLGTGAREAARYYEETRTSAERLAAELKKISKLQAAGKIDIETARRAAAAARSRAGTDDMGSIKKGVDSLNGKGNAAAAMVLARSISAVAKSFAEVSVAIRTGGDVGEAIENIVAANPVTGPWWEAGKAIREVFTGEQAYIAEMKKLGEEMERQQAIVKNLNKERTKLAEQVADVRWAAQVAAMTDLPEGYGKSMVVAATKFQSTERDAVRAFEAKMAELREMRGKGNDRLADDAFNKAAAQAATLRDDTITAARKDMERAQAAASDADQSAFAAGVADLQAQRRVLEAILSGVPEDLARMQDQIGAMQSLTEEQKKQAADRLATEYEITQRMKDQVANATAVSQRIEQLQTQFDQLGMTDMEQLIASMKKLGATAEQIEQATSLQRNIDQAKEAAAIREKIRTDAERLAAEMEKINKLEEARHLTAAEASAAREQLQTEYDDRQAKDAPKEDTSGGPQLLQAGSAAAASFIAQAMRSESSGPAEQMVKRQDKANKSLAQLVKNTTPREASDVEVVEF